MLQSPVWQAFLATTFTWFMTALGAAMVFFFRTINKRALDLMLGFAAGVMTAASCWSLLQPAIEMSEASGAIKWVPPLVGFLLGGAFLLVADLLLPHMHPGGSAPGPEGLKSTWRRTILLVTAITLHNIPEGLAVGVALGAAAADMPQASIGAAIVLAIGMGLQNLPEGAATSIPLRREGMSRWKSFLWGQASGIVEPLAGVLGVLLTVRVQAILPYALAFAAGAMIYVVVEELIPEAQSSGDSNIATIGAMLGFALMMVLDVALG
jgi:ZIP family zinc transporter